MQRAKLYGIGIEQVASFLTRIYKSMKAVQWVFLVAWTLLFLTGCGKKAPKTEEVVIRDIQIPGPPKPDTLQIHADRLRIQSEIDSLLPHFAFKQHNLPIASYYHRNWNERYCVYGTSLIAGVDSLGRFFLIDIYNCSIGTRFEEDQDFHRPEDCDSAHSWLELRLPDTTVRIYREPSLPQHLWPGRKAPIKRDVFISTGYFCSDYYPIMENEWLLRRLADPDLKSCKHYRRCDGKGIGDVGTVSKRHREGIADCAQLALKMEELRLAEAMMTLSRLEMGIGGGN